MIKLGIRAKIKTTGEIVNHQVNVDDKIYKTDKNSLYGFVSDFLDERHGDIFKWFRFWKILNHNEIIKYKGPKK